MKTTKADKWFSSFIRIRDAWDDGYCRCITCGKVQLPKEADCGHWIKRQHQATRFNEMNAAAQCGKCNRFEQGRDDVFRAKLVAKYGEEKVLLLESAKRTICKTSQLKIDYLAAYYKQKATELSRIKGIVLWMLLIFMAIACKKEVCHDCTNQAGHPITYCGYTEDEFEQVIEWNKRYMNDTLKCKP